LSSYCFNIRACSSISAALGEGVAGGGVGDFAAVLGRAGKSGASPLSNRFGGSYEKAINYMWATDLK
jgi:hypothetical protein